MKVTDEGVKELCESEGLRLKAYPDVAGKFTIGYGSTFYENGSPVKEGDEISQERAVQLFRYHLQSRVEVPLTSLLEAPVEPHHFDALCSLVYNIGIGAFSKSTLRRKLNAKDFEGAADEFVRWRKAGGRDVRGLLRRRFREMELFVFGRKA